MDHRQSDDEAAVFRRSVGAIKRLRNDKILPAQKKPKPEPVQQRQDEARVMRELLTHPLEDVDHQPGDTLSFCRPGIQNQVFRKLKRGQYRISRELDLHGMTVAEAQAALREFIQQVRDEDIRCVKIIHGKGARSPNRGPVIKPLVNRWLRRRDEILAFSSALFADGGTGAVYVLLRGR